MKMTRNQKIFAGMLISVVLVVGAISLKILAVLSLPSDESSIIPQAYVGPLPADICIVDGMPQIYGGSSTEREYTLVYLRKNGDVVIAKWFNQFPGPMDEGYKITPTLGVYWTGGKCPGS